MGLCWRTVPSQVFAVRQISSCRNTTFNGGQNPYLSLEWKEHDTPVNTYSKRNNRLQCTSKAIVRGNRYNLNSSQYFGDLNENIITGQNRGRYKYFTKHPKVTDLWRNDFESEAIIPKSDRYTQFVANTRFTVNHSANYNQPKNTLSNEVLACTANAPGNTKGGENQGRASAEQLDFIFNKLSDDLPRLFIRIMDYKPYDPNLIFENNIKNRTTVGIFPYVQQVSLLRTCGHLKFAYVKFEILKITKKPEDSAVIVRWQISGVSGFTAFFMFWKIKLWNLKESLDARKIWYEGLSTFYVGPNGLIQKHVADKVMPDEDNLALERDIKPSVAAKLALLIGLFPKNQLSDMLHISSQEDAIKLFHPLKMNKN